MTTPGRRMQDEGGEPHPAERLRFLSLACRLGACSLLLLGCSVDEILKSSELPPEVTDPAVTETRAGALAAYNGTLEAFRVAFGGSDHRVSSTYPAITGLLTDELQLGGGRLGQLGVSVSTVDARVLHSAADDEDVRAAYSKLQRVRGQASQALGLLSRYAPEERTAAGHTYALQAYAVIFLAELFCSGVPLSTLDFGADYTLRAGSDTRGLYEHALALLDTALALSTDNTGVLNLARLGRARALLGMGELQQAADAVAAVPDDFVYDVPFRSAGTGEPQSFAWIPPGSEGWLFSVSDREGLNGLPYRTAGDPRVLVELSGMSRAGYPIYHPAKYAADGSSPITVASGIEARLIEAEAALARGDDWLAMLNALRTDGTFTIADESASAGADTSWAAGSGNVADLAPLEDPGSPDARIDLLFRERAFWLFLTGQRQGDLRRLIRQYGRSERETYPTGRYPATGSHDYGWDVTLPVPVEESVFNPHFTGCFSRDA